MNTRLLLISALLPLSICMANAIELLEPVRLTNGQFESNAVAGFRTTVAGEDVHYVLGSTQNAQGQTVPCIWRRPTATGITEEAVLPIPPGFQGQCTSGGEFTNGDQAIVGNLTVGANSFAVLWRKPFGGSWSPPEALFPGSPRSRLQGTERREADEEGNLEVRSAGSIEVNGQLRPVVVTTGEEDNVFALLPIPAGAQGEALGADLGSAGEVAACGWSQMPGGRKKPCMWTMDSGAWGFRPIPIPSNAAGQANDVLRIDGGWATCGAITRSNRTRGFVMPIDSEVILLDPLDGHQNSSAHSILYNGHAGLGANLADHPLQDDVFFVTGQAWNTGGPPTATVQAANSTWTFTNGYPFAATDLRYDGGDTGTHEIGHFQFSDGFAFGDMDVEDSPFNSACLFLPTQTQVPDQLSLLAGRYGSGDFSGLWHQNDIGLFTAKVIDLEGSFKGLLVEVVFAPFSTVVGSTYTATISARLAGSGANAGGTMNIYAVDPVLGTTTLASSHSLTTDNQLLTSTLPGLASQWAHATTGKVKLRFELVTSGPGRPTLVWDLARLRLD